MSMQGKLPFNPIIWPAVPHDYTGSNNLGYYTVETTQRYVWGTRGITWDGKVFKYARSKDTTLYSGYGARNGAEADVSDLINSNTTIAIVAGDTSTTVTLASDEGYDSAGGLAEDELAGAQLTIGHGSAGTAETRTVTSNTLLAAGGGTTIVTVDAPWAYAHAAGFMELPMNPYGYLIRESEVSSVMGVPCRSTDTSGYHLWIQTWGMCWVVPGGADSTPGNSADDRSVYFVGDGSVNGGTVIDAAARGHQLAGFIVDATEVGTGTMPTVMLQISI